MEVKDKKSLEVKIGERVYAFDCDPSSPLGEIHDALCQMKSFVINKMIDAEKKPASEIAEEQVQVVE